MSHDNEDRENAPLKTESTEEGTEPASKDGSHESQGGQAKPVSPQKLAANRANAEHSTGPKTPEGKEKSKQNSRKHGFFARMPLPAGEAGDKLFQQYSDLVAGISEYYQPVGYMEGLLTEKIATESIRFSRLLAYESRPVGEQRAFHWDGIDRILRFQSAINRQLFQAMHELERLQDRRKGKPKPNPPKGSGETLDDGAGGPSAASDGENRGPDGRLTPFESPADEMYRTPSTSEGDPVPAKVQPARDGHRQAPEPHPQVTNYGTNPTSARAGEPDGDTAPGTSLGPKNPLADLVSQRTDPPHADVPTALALTTSEDGEVRKHDNAAQESESCSTFITAEDRALFDKIQNEMREGDPEDLP